MSKALNETKNFKFLFYAMKICNKYVRSKNTLYTQVGTRVTAVKFKFGNRPTTITNKKKNANYFITN